MDDSTFVEAMARLHALDRNSRLADATRDSLRRRVLQEEGLTSAELERQARHYADDPARAAAIWGAINTKMGVLLTDTAAARRAAEPGENGAR